MIRVLGNSDVPIKQRYKCCYLKMNLVRGRFGAVIKRPLCMRKTPGLVTVSLVLVFLFHARDRLRSNTVNSLRY